MAPTTYRVLLLGILGLGSVACGPRVAGRWESERDALPCNDPITFEVGDDLIGKGESCSCDFTLRFEDRDTGDYDVEVDFEGGLDCLFANEGHYDCALSDDGDQLDCEEIGDFERVD